MAAALEVMAHIVMAHIVMAYIAAAYIVMALLKTKSVGQQVPWAEHSGSVMAETWERRQLRIDGSWHTHMRTHARTHARTHFESARRPGIHWPM